MSYNNFPELFEKETKIWMDAFPESSAELKQFSDKILFEIRMMSGDKLTLSTDSNNSQPNTPTTNGSGENKSGKRSRDLAHIHSAENTTGADTQQGKMTLSTESVEK